MHLDPIMTCLAGAILAVLISRLLLREIKQPYVTAYLLAGIIFGPHGLALITEQTC